MERDRGYARTIETKTTLSHSPTSAGAARRFVRDVLMTRQVSDEVVEVVELLTSEVVTNAIVHAGEGPELVLRITGARIRVEVADAAASVPARRAEGHSISAGLGMTIVEELACDWGVEHVPHGKRVWFEVSQDAQGKAVWPPEPFG